MKHDTVNKKNETPPINGYHFWKTAKILAIWCLSAILASRTTKTSFKLHCYVYVDNFEQYLESCALNTQNA